MANTWRVGQFGLTSFDDHNHTLGELIQHFSDDINSRYTDIPISDGKVDEPTYTLIPGPLGKVAEPTYVMVPAPLGKVSEPSYVMIPETTGKVAEPTYTVPTQVALPTPVYEDLIINT